MGWLSWEKMVTLWMIVVSIGFLLRTLALHRIEKKLDKLLKDKEDVVYMCPGPHDWMSMGIDDKIEYFGCRRPKCMASKKVAKDKENGDGEH